MNILDLTRGFLDIGSKRGGITAGAVTGPIVIQPTKPARYVGLVYPKGGKFQQIDEGEMTLELAQNDIFTGGIRNTPSGAMPSENGTGNSSTFKGNIDSIASVTLTGTLLKITGVSLGNYVLDITAGDGVTKGKLTVTVVPAIPATKIVTDSLYQHDLIVGATSTYGADITPKNASGFTRKIEVEIAGNIVTPAPDWIKDNGDGTFTALKPHTPAGNEKLRMTLINADGTTVSDSSGLAEAKALGVDLNDMGDIAPGATKQVTILDTYPDVITEGAKVRYAITTPAAGASINATGLLSVAAGSAAGTGAVTVYVDWRGTTASASKPFTIKP